MKAPFQPSFTYGIVSLAIIVGLAAPSSAGPILYGATHRGSSGPSDLYTIDPSTGTATLVGPIGFGGVGGIDFASDGTLHGVSSETGELIAIDPATGAGTAIGPLGERVQFDIAFRNRDDALFGTGFASAFPPEFCIGVHTIDTGTGAATPLGSSSTCDTGNALAFSATDELYQVDVFALIGSVYTIDQLSGLANPVAPIRFLGFPGLSNFPRINAMDFHPSSDVLYVSVNDGSAGAGPSYLATLDPFTGSVTHIGLTAPGLDALAWSTPSAVPAPAAILLFALGLAGISVTRRRRVRR